MLTRNDLHEYQKKAVEFFLSKKKVALFLDMGLGKTISTLTALTDLHDSCSVNKTLIIGPLRVANTVWHTEAANWNHTKHLKLNICTGSEQNRRAQLHKSADIYVINKENVEWLVNLYGKKWPFDCVIIDESSCFKSSSSKRWKALRKVIPYIEYTALLTGTPAPNGLLDLWPQIYLIDSGARLGRNMTAYKQRFFETDYMGYKHTLRHGSEDKIHSLVSDISLSMVAEDYLQLPDRIDLTRSVKIPPKLTKQYKELEDEFYLELDDGNDIEAVNAAVVANKLLQFCNGAMFTDDTGNWSEVHKLKIDALKELVEENESENILIAYNYKSDRERILKAFPDAVILDKEGEAVTRWNNGEIKILLAHPASAGHGLNLQKGGSLLVWFGLTWSLELYQQFNARLHRQGQQKPVRIVHIVAENCIDERVCEVLKDKEITQDKLINALK